MPKPLAAAAVLAVLAALGIVAAVRWLRPVALPEPPSPAMAPYQRSYRELSADEQRVYFSLRSALTTAESHRATHKSWPDPSALAGEGLAAFSDERLEWRKLSGGLYVNYLGVPKSHGLRWLVMVIEPDPKQLKLPNESAPPQDLEHHTLADGTAIHVTLWSQPNTGPLPVAVVPYPVADGWTERR